MAPLEWIGGLSLDGEDAIYNVGSSQSGFQDNGQRMKMSVRNEQVLKDITNVFGTIRGSTEPGKKESLSEIPLGEFSKHFVEGGVDCLSMLLHCFSWVLLPSLCVYMCI